MATDYICLYFRPYANCVCFSHSCSQSTLHQRVSLSLVSSSLWPVFSLVFFFLVHTTHVILLIPRAVSFLVYPFVVLSLLRRSDSFNSMYPFHVISIEMPSVYTRTILCAG